MILIKSYDLYIKIIVDKKLHVEKDTYTQYTKKIKSP